MGGQHKLPAVGLEVADVEGSWSEARPEELPAAAALASCMALVQSYSAIPLLPILSMLGRGLGKMSYVLLTAKRARHGM